MRKAVDFQTFAVCTFLLSAFLGTCFACIFNAYLRRGAPLSLIFAFFAIVGMGIIVSLAWQDYTHNYRRRD
jgi:ABC-type spermidine/putrescine transport system permease subunit II